MVKMKTLTQFYNTLTFKVKYFIGKSFLFRNKIQAY